MTKSHSMIKITGLLVTLTWIFSFAAFAERGAGITREMLPHELKSTTISKTSIPFFGKEAGVIHEISGIVIVARENLKQAYFAAPGDKIFEKDTVFTLKNSRCRFRLLFEDVISAGENARISVTKFIDDKKTQEKHASFSMARGKVMFYTIRLFRYKTASMTVETPTAIAGVRGTKFGVEVVQLKGENETARRQIHVADTSDRAFIYLAQANRLSPPLFQTTVLCFSGTIYVGSTVPPPPGGGSPPPIVTLSQGQMTTVGTGNLPAPPSVTSPAMILQFQNDTGGGGTVTSGGGIIISGGGTGLLGGGTTTTTTGSINTDVAQAQNTQGVIGVAGTSAATANQAPWKGIGYFTGLLNYGYPIGEVFISRTPQNFAGQIAATYDQGGSYIMGVGSRQSIGSVVSPAVGTWSGSQPVTIVSLGANEYMSWGTWTQPTAMVGTYNTFNFNNLNYYVNGTTIPSLPTTGSYTYSGPAYGTLFSSTGGVAMTGSFAANVNFNTAQITNYYMTVTNGSNAAIINIPGAIAISNSATAPNFSANQTQGTWTLSTAGGSPPVNSGKLYGSFFGTTANNMGTVWSMSTDSTPRATGVAIGNTKTPKP